MATFSKIATVASEPSAEIGEGTLNVGVGDQRLSVEIGSENNTLAGIRDAINNHEDNSLVSAAIIQDDRGERLVLTSLS